MGKHGTLLKELDENLRKLTKELKSFTGQVYDDKMLLKRKQFTALKEIDRFISKYEWVGSEKNVERIKFFRESGYDYSLVRDKFDIGSNALKSFIYRTNQKLEQVVGADTIDMIMSKYDKVAYGIINFRILSKTYKLEDILLPDCYKEFPTPKLDLYKMYDCKDEIAFCYTYSKAGFENALEQIDKDKLAFLLYISQNSVDKYKEEQKDFIQVIQGINIELNEYLEQLKEQEKEDVPFDLD